MGTKKKEIVVLTGEVNPNILIIAPHGVMGDDDNAGKLARAIHKKLDCHAIINEVFKKPEKDDKGKYGDADFKKFFADLNYKPHAEAHLTFINEITNKINDPAHTTVFWIHGIKDENLAEEAKKRSYGDARCLVGYGQGNGNGETMKADTAKEFVKLLTVAGIPTKPTHAQSKKYRGASATNMNQYFKTTGGDLADVQSVQLEFGKEGVRVGKDIQATGTKVAQAISKLLNCELVNDKEQEEDESLVKEATEKVITFIKANHDNSIQVGRYLIEKFYGNDFEKARRGKKVKGKSFNKMLDELQKTPNTPSKSWFYNTINLAVDDEEFKGDEDYKKLNLSHKIYLTYLNKKTEWQTAKLGLIKEIARSGMLIKELSARIDDIKDRTQEKYEWPSIEQIASLNDEEKKKHRDKAEKRKQTLEKAIQDLKVKLFQQETELVKCEQVITAVVTPAEETPMAKAA